MPTIIGHSISGAAIGMVFSSKSQKLRVITLCIICSVVPDFDAIGFKLGIPYHHWLGHRGFSHSILFAVIFAFIATLFMIGVEKSLKKRVFVFSAFLTCILSHDLLDAMTNGGLGIAFFSPFNDQRFFFPWRPIEVSPISPRRFFTTRGMEVMTSELFWVIIPSLCCAFMALFIRIKRNITSRPS